MRRLLLVLLLLAGCGESIGLEGTTIGGACSGTMDCDPEAMCLTDDDFPGGTCSIRCAGHEDCFDGARCVEHEGNDLCLLACDLPSDCRGGYSCKGKDSVAPEGGESLVCIAD